MVWSLLGVAVLALLCAHVQAQCSGSANNHSIWSGSPRFVRKVDNGTLFSADAQPGNALPVMHLYGSAYDMGFAHGQLLREQVVQFFIDFENYAEQQLAPYVKNLPQDIQKIIEKEGVLAGLQFTADLTKAYTPQRFFDEMRGLADALAPAVSYEKVVQVQMFPELIKASCSMFGAWGPALAQTDYTLVQLRALDFGIDGPLTNYPVLTVYHPSEGHTFASLSWMGFIGSVTSYSGIMGVSEKVWIHYNLTSSRAGIPFHFLLRDIAQFDNTLDDTINRMVNAERTCSIFVGFGANNSKQFRVAEYGHEEVLIYDDQNYPVYLPAHPKMDGVVFVDKHTQPSDDPCLGSLMQRYYGQLTPENTLRNIVAPFQTGDLHAAVYDFQHNMLYASVAGVPISASGQPRYNDPAAPAYDRPWFKFDATALFAQQRV